MFKRGNLAAFSPSPDLPVKRTEAFDPLSGRSVVHTEPIVNSKDEKQKEGLELK
jgi:hypothetical protein